MLEEESEKMSSWSWGWSLLYFCSEREKKMGKEDRGDKKYCGVTFYKYN